MSELDDNSRRFIDEMEIKKVVLRYARAVDRMDEELLRSCYHPDAIDDHGPYTGPVDGFVDWVMPVLAGFESTTHFISNQLVEVDGDVAWAESYCFALHRTRSTEGEPTLDIFRNVRYVDRFERRDGPWRIVHRVVVREPGREDVVSEELPHDRLGTGGKRDRSDPSYDRSR